MRKRTNFLRNGVVLPQNGKVTYRMGDDFIELYGESSGHDSDFIRGDTLNRDQKNVIFNALSPKDWHIEIKCGSTKNEEK